MLLLPHSPSPLPLLPCSSRTVNKNRLHVKLCLASVKRSSTIDSNRPEHDVASVPPPASTSLPCNLPPSPVCPAGAAILHALWLHLLAGFVCASAFFLAFPLFILFFGTFIIIFLLFAHFSRFYVFWTLLSRRAAGIK